MTMMLLLLMMMMLMLMTTVSLSMLLLLQGWKTDLWMFAGSGLTAFAASDFCAPGQWTAAQVQPCIIASSFALSSVGTDLGLLCMSAMPEGRHRGNVDRERKEVQTSNALPPAAFVCGTR